MIRSIYRKALPLQSRILIRTLIGSITKSSDQTSLIDRRLIASQYLKGEGIEIGALNFPLDVPSTARVKYVDRLSLADLRKHYPELGSMDLVEPDILADGEQLESIEAATQDFVIANHFIEHCQNPFLALRNMFRVLKDCGILYMAIPDKRYTFDVDRRVTTIEHLLADYERGPAWSRRQHFEDWARFVNKCEDNEQMKARADELMEMDYSIHYHVWTQADMFELLPAVKSILGVSFDVELFLKNEHECIFILRKGDHAALATSAPGHHAS